MDPNIIVWVFSGISLLIGLTIFVFHLCNRKLHKNPCKQSDLMKLK